MIGPESGIWGTGTILQNLLFILKSQKSKQIFPLSSRYVADSPLRQVTILVIHGSNRGGVGFFRSEL